MGLTGFMKRLTASEEDLYAEEVRAESDRPGCTRCNKAGPGSTVKVAGRVTTVVFTPTTSMPVLEAELFDGTSTVTLAWLGRRRIVGIEPGRKLVAAGRVAERDGGRKVIYNPWYEIAIDSDAGR